MTPRLRDCGNPACRICRWNRGSWPPDSGHPEPKSFASLLLGAAALTLLFVAAFVLLPVLMEVPR